MCSVAIEGWQSPAEGLLALSPGHDAWDVWVLLQECFLQHNLQAVVPARQWQALLAWAGGRTFGFRGCDASLPDLQQLLCTDADYSNSLCLL
jgi:hypothetical protein